MLMLPLVFIGVVWGLLLFGKSLDFFAILGLLGLIGMNIKNAIVLVDEIGLQLKDGKGAVPAVVEATKTRIVPVTMASGTTILGMLPLLGDAMFCRYGGYHYGWFVRINGTDHFCSSGNLLYFL